MIIPFDADDVFVKNGKIIFCGTRNGHSLEWFENKVLRITSCPKSQHIGRFYRVIKVHPFYDNFGNVGSAIGLQVNPHCETEEP
jgi:hypothetical protein